MTDEKYIPKPGLLKNFMKEFFPYSEFKKIGLFTTGMKGDYEAQAKKICDYFGFKTVYEYGAMEVTAHITYVNTDSKSGLDVDISKPFITVIPSIYD